MTQVLSFGFIAPAAKTSPALLLGELSLRAVRKSEFCALRRKSEHSPP